MQAGQRQVRFVGANSGGLHVCLSADTMTGAWVSGQPARGEPARLRL